MTADISYRDPGDLLAALPYQLGYHPTDSVVLVALDGRRVGLVARCDIPPVDAVAAVARAVLEPVLRERFGAGVLVGYEEEPDASVPLLLRLVEDLEAAEVEVVDVAVVRGGRRYSPTCAEPCCPPDGVPVPDAADVPAVAELVALGRAPLSSRDDVSAMVEPDGAVAPDVGAALRRRPAAPPPERVARAWARVLAPPEPAGGSGRAARSATPRVLADAVRGLADVAWRDALIGWLAPGVLPPDILSAPVVARLERTLPRWGGMGAWAEPSTPAPGRDLLLERLLSVCRAVPDGRPVEAAAVCTVLAHVAWCDGEGALARSALDRALRLDPTYRLAMLLARLVDHGVRMSPGPPAAGAMGRAG